MFAYQRRMPNDVHRLSMLIELSGRSVERANERPNEWVAERPLNKPLQSQYPEQSCDVWYASNMHSCLPSSSGDEMRTNTKFMLRTHKQFSILYRIVPWSMHWILGTRSQSPRRIRIQLKLKMGKMGSTNGIALRSTNIFFTGARARDDSKLKRVSVVGRIQRRGYAIGQQLRIYDHMNI